MTNPLDAGWRPIESAPKDGTRVALRFESGWEDDGTWRTTYGGEWHSGAFHYLPWSPQPTHWQPLPDPPAALGAGRGG